MYLCTDICKLFNLRERNYDKKTNHVNGGDRPKT